MNDASTTNTPPHAEIVKTSEGRQNRCVFDCARSGMVARCALQRARRGGPPRCRVAPGFLKNAHAELPGAPSHAPQKRFDSAAQDRFERVKDLETSLSARFSDPETLDKVRIGPGAFRVFERARRVVCSLAGSLAGVLRSAVLGRNSRWPGGEPLASRWRLWRSAQPLAGGLRGRAVGRSRWLQ